MRFEQPWRAGGEKKGPSELNRNARAVTWHRTVPGANGAGVCWIKHRAAVRPAANVRGKTRALLRPARRDCGGQSSFGGRKKIGGLYWTKFEPSSLRIQSNRVSSSRGTAACGSRGVQLRSHQRGRGDAVCELGTVLAPRPDAAVRGRDHSRWDQAGGVLHFGSQSGGERPGDRPTAGGRD